MASLLTTETCQVGVDALDEVLERVGDEIAVVDDREAALRAARRPLEHLEELLPQEEVDPVAGG
jgi:hypothetical protein